MNVSRFLFSLFAGLIVGCIATDCWAQAPARSN